MSFLFDNPVNRWFQRRSLFRGGPHHAIIAAAVLACAHWAGVHTGYVGTVVVTYYWAEGIGYVSAEHDYGLPLTWDHLSDPLTDALWPTAVVVAWLSWIA